MCDPSLENLRLDLSLGNFGLGSFALKRSFENLRFRFSACEFPLRFHQEFIQISFFWPRDPFPDLVQKWSRLRFHSEFIQIPKKNQTLTHPTSRFFLEQKIPRIRHRPGNKNKALSDNICRIGKKLKYREQNYYKSQTEF